MYKDYKKCLLFFLYLSSVQKYKSYLSYIFNDKLNFFISLNIRIKENKIIKSPKLSMLCHVFINSVFISLSSYTNDNKIISSLVIYLVYL